MIPLTMSRKCILKAFGYTVATLVGPLILACFPARSLAEEDGAGTGLSGSPRNEKYYHYHYRDSVQAYLNEIRRAERETESEA